jgi:hypothetical protein
VARRQDLGYRKAAACWSKAGGQLGGGAPAAGGALVAGIIIVGWGVGGGSTGKKEMGRF